VSGSGKFVQIAVAATETDGNSLYALDEDGGVWFFGDGVWEQLPNKRENAK
jgi:hypothetical protein